MAKTVSAKVPNEMKAEIEREGINVSEVIREALDEALTAQRRSDLRCDGADLRERVGGRVDTDTVVDVIRETRREH